MNYYLLNIKNNEFISAGIIKNVVNCNFKYYKYMDYIVYFYNNNYKNNFHAAIVNIKVEKDQIYSRYIYSNINNRR